jgi:hypothetical protein
MTGMDMVKVWAVNAIHTPWVSYGPQKIAVFSTEQLAKEWVAYLESQRTDEQRANPETWGYGWGVNEWTVDDPRFLALIGPEE